MEHYQIHTLVDITKTDVNRSDKDSLLRDQQRNYQTLIQSLGLRTQPMNITNPVIIHGTFDYFGEMYQTEQKVWQIEFANEHKGVFGNNKHQYGLLLEDLNEVPIINGLEETARFLLPCFFTTGPCKNLHISIKGTPSAWF